jgi:NAD(P)H-quinone oxidoreductase subunit 5
MGALGFDFLVDSMSLAFGALSALLCGIVAAFSDRYLHRDPGFNRYFILFATFVLGIELVALAGSVEVLIAGWEFLGLSSALLVGFFHDRRAPVVNALRVFAVYRVGDVAMLSAAVLLHHTAGSGSLLMLFSASASESTVLPAGRATLIALLLIVAVAGKSALLPFSGWLPRAMEGPTPSSAVYYGALSIHAGCFLLLRAGPVLEQSTLARALAALVGFATALYATMSARVQSDVKSTLAYGALTHVGLIVLEIALGLYTLAFLHIVGHACFRLMQFLTAPNVMHDLHELVESRPGAAFPGRWIPPRFHSRLYLFALERGFLDSLIDRFVVGPFQALAGVLDRVDRALCSGGREVAGVAIGESRDD